MGMEPFAGSNQGHNRSRERAQERLRLWRARALYSIGGFVLSCATIYLFLEGQPLHRYWESFGKYLILLCIGLLLALLYCVGLWWTAWHTSR
jgi:hypothetical protein